MTTTRKRSAGANAFLDLPFEMQTDEAFRQLPNEVREELWDELQDMLWEEILGGRREARLVRRNGRDADWQGWPPEESLQANLIAIRPRGLPLGVFVRRQKPPVPLEFPLQPGAR
jgi:hypothetical protein